MGSRNYLINNIKRESGAEKVYLGSAKPEEEEGRAVEDVDNPESDQLVVSIEREDSANDWSNCPRSPPLSAVSAASPSPSGISLSSSRCSESSCSERHNAWPCLRSPLSSQAR